MRGKTESQGTEWMVMLWTRGKQKRSEETGHESEHSAGMTHIEGACQYLDRQAEVRWNPHKGLKQLRKGDRMVREESQGWLPEKYQQVSVRARDIDKK